MTTLLGDLIDAIKNEVLELGDIPERELTEDEAASIVDAINAIKNIRMKWLSS